MNDKNTKFIYRDLVFKNCRKDIKMTTNIQNTKSETALNYQIDNSVV